ncbi:tRNA (adenosine(37)-N6)-threonylcarbamoyltransferase complex dimerization subunit type 1 TsaB [Robertkochia marina]|uniref:tRNA (Adenosine(37)-N6)-threonylcarbamoyltransferase complex dimerization subunit type 1 TsaB n=1 Tax=Robertkochia marina TaxID=1227945 RepID=A0A4S3M5U6_9FLAO|nr:tRNA (adenosine(37)-N6)-threonylcarbamoyltransferase complex dimerization subunit type 1 TsaB [Robertkochia marina]THD69587.1 tRNA (adenosine(37)-N6)-threonylcarbamoyltransferase complex dimerization subunit type 1 TsaB [Robertkochia marina]TRZ47158.1 tRNA (adenosine(37)-N6)-threonylcarbamoyltransferase complex dimerization subunit type 1 TsaB [Robertkochia marina]
MATILNIETATTNCSVSIGRQGEVAFLRETAGQGYSHAENLHTFIKEGMEALQLTYAELDAIAVSMGPGSYTGLRIGVSAAKGLCFAADLPLIAIPTLDILNAQLKPNEGLVIPMLDARRMEVYAAVYDIKGTRVVETRAVILDEHSFGEELRKGKVHFLGNASEKTAEIIQDPNAIFHTDLQLPSAKEMAMLAEHRFQENLFQDVAYFEPYYLKDFMVTPKKA